MPGAGMIISTRLDPQLSDEFVEMCDKRKVERSALLRDLIQDWLLKEQAKDLHTDDDFSR
jgi:metal-responsive CopG/Arc/MetJ family transcriptional regulator